MKLTMSRRIGIVIVQSPRKKNGCVIGPRLQVARGSVQEQLGCRAQFPQLTACSKGSPRELGCLIRWD